MRIWIRDPVSFGPGSGIWDGKIGSGINIPYPQNWTLQSKKKVEMKKLKVIIFWICFVQEC